MTKHSLIKKFILLAILGAASVNVFCAEQQSATDSANYSKEQMNLSEIATFRDNYIPHEYLPLPENLVYIDMAVLLALIGTGTWLVLRRKPARYLTWLAIITLAYLGIVRGGCICPMGLTTNVIMGVLNPYMISMVGLVIFIAPLITALVAGRVFCTSGCPLGAIQHLINKKKRDIKIPPRIHRFLKAAPVLVLLLTIYTAIRGTMYIGCELDPYKPVFFTGKAWFEQGTAVIIGTPMEARFLFSFGIFGWIYLLATLVAGYWIQRPFCRLLCPYSALLGVISLASFRKRKIDATRCTFCKACVKHCPTQAIAIDKKLGVRSLSNYDCIQCNRCSDSCKFDAV